MTTVSLTRVYCALPKSTVRRRRSPAPTSTVWLRPSRITSSWPSHKDGKVVAVAATRTNAHNILISLHVNTVLLLFFFLSPLFSLIRSYNVLSLVHLFVYTTNF